MMTTSAYGVDTPSLSMSEYFIPTDLEELCNLLFKSPDIDEEIYLMRPMDDTHMMCHDWPEGPESSPWLVVEVLRLFREGKWVAIGHLRHCPMIISICAECSKYLYNLDYLCDTCRQPVSA